MEEVKVQAIGVIPARLRSTRLEQKVLRLIAGRPMIQHVWERAKESGKLKDVIVACDDPSIKSCVQNFGGKAILTREDHPNGTSRVAEIAERERADVFINIQADEPMLRPEGIDQLVEAFEKDNQIEVATLGVRLDHREDYENPNVVKVVCDESGNALYFSRAPIPYFKNNTAGPRFYVKHLGIYGYRRDFLSQIVEWPAGDLENKEKLEQLRILEKGYKIRVLETEYDSLGVDTAEDLMMVEEKMKKYSRKSGV